MHLAADFVFQVELLLRKLILQFADLAIGKRILDRERNLAGDLHQQIDIVLGKRVLLKPAKAQDSEDTVAISKEQQAGGFNPSP